MEKRMSLMNGAQGRKLRTVCLVSVVFCAAISKAEVKLRCSGPTADVKASTVLYVGKRFHVDPSTILVSSLGEVSNSCFWKLRFETREPKRSLVLYLAPDGKHLVSTLYDLHIDPLREEQQERILLNEDLSAGSSAEMGPSSAKITIVEFSDFECPYCKKLASSLGSLKQASRYGSDVRIIFKNFPLPMHEWALAAAKSGYCLNKVDKELFWQFHDYVFANQESMSEQIVRTKAIEYLETTHRIATNVFLTCVDSSDAQTVIQADIATGKSQGVNATPTLFINGQKIEGAIDLEELKKYVSAAANQAPVL